MPALSNTQQTAYAANDNGGSISYRTAGYMEKTLLKRAQESMIFERFGQAKTLPKSRTLTMKWRRYLSLAPSMTPLQEGVTPTGTMLKFVDISARLFQYGAVISLTDVLQDSHEDPLLQEMAKLAGEQAADTMEFIRYGYLCAGTNVIYSGGAAGRAALVATAAAGGTAGVVNKQDLELAERALRRHRCKPVTQIVGATAKVSTQPVAAAYFAVCHTDMMAPIRAMDGFVPIEKYASTSTALPEEFGKVGSFRFIATTYAEPIEVADVAAGADYLGQDATGSITGDASAAVYPILIFGRDAYGIIAFQGEKAVRVSVINPSKISKSDPLGQIGYVGWKTYSATRILNDSFMMRLESLSPELGEVNVSRNQNYWGQEYLLDAQNGLDNGVKIDAVNDKTVAGDLADRANEGDNVVETSTSSALGHGVIVAPTTNMKNVTA